MGTSTEPTREELVADIKHALEAMGLPLRRGAGKLYDVLHPESDDDEERLRFIDNFKKQTARPTTSPQILKQYLSALQEFDEFKKSDMYFLHTPRSEHLSDELSSEIRAISKKVNHLVKSHKN